MYNNHHLSFYIALVRKSLAFTPLIEWRFVYLQVDTAFVSLTTLYNWCERVQAYFNGDLFPVQPATQTPVFCTKGHTMPKVKIYYPSMCTWVLGGV